MSINGIPVKAKIDAGQVLKISAFKEVIKPTVPHKHDNYYELIVLYQGSGYHVIDDTNYEVLPPTAYFLKPGQTHCWSFSKIPKGYVILFREELLTKEDLEIIYNLKTEISLKDSALLIDLVSKFNEEYKSDSENLKLIRAYLHLILIKISAFSAISTSNTKSFNAVFYKYKSLINENYHQIKRTQDYASLLNVTAPQLNIICKNASGKTASVLLNERLLLESKTLLTNTDFSINEIAANLQFSDSSHLVKFFKLYTNLTPGQYRELAFKQRAADE
ncbi:MAG: AraC family transcriptional regulator [Daejeonella sp.]